VARGHTRYRGAQNACPFFVVLDGYAVSCFIVDSPSAVIVVQMSEGKDTPTLLQGKEGLQC
jgi:hypothetical protein